MDFYFYMDNQQRSHVKDNKLINIPSARVKAQEEFVVMAAVIPQGQSVALFAGKCKLTLKPLPWRARPP